MPKESLWRLRHECHGALARIDGSASVARDRIARLTAGAQFPEFEALKIVRRALILSASSGDEWPSIAHRLCDEAEQARSIITAPAEEHDRR